MSRDNSRLACVAGDDYALLLWEYGDAAAAMEGEWREETCEELLSLSPVHSVHDHIPRYEVMPDGWRFDRTWGSAVTGYVPICDGVSPLKGGRKGLLRLAI